MGWINLDEKELKLETNLECVNFYGDRELMWQDLEEPKKFLSVPSFSLDYRL
jgi:hypothetical protein